MRVHINLDEEVVRQIDDLAGKRGRSAFIRSVVAAEAERQWKLKRFWSAVGSIPDFAPGVTAATISADRKRETAARERKLAPSWKRYDAARYERSD